MDPTLAQLRRQYPMVSDLERRARWRMPRFAFEFLQGGAGDETGMPRNRAALQSVQVVPRYGVSVGAASPETELFGHRYAAPIGIAPIGFDGIMWPGATRLFAQAAQARNIPYMVGTLATETIETVCALAPDVTWFQLYPLAADDHRVTFDLAARADAAGAKVLAATLDVPARTKRPRDMRNGFGMPFKLTAGMLWQAGIAWPWALAIAKRGIPTFANIERYSGPGRDVSARYVGQHVGGGFDWEVLARLRDRWKGPMMVKGILHPKDAEKAVSLGIDGIVVSNHGGRQFDASPASVDMLPAIAAAVGSRATVMLDSGVTAGVDVLRALALGAKGVFAGRAFMLGLGGIGDLGAQHMAGALIEELTLAMAQSGVTTTDQIATLATHHPGAWRFDA
ncbi:alpha-hydroxy acid oxidase [Pararhodobacter zhoushanensis]|uniref:Alpha-hydroxy-acid oxidizing protein n=1 Tax=Pararhodobacter zhoushanensis TaxID=2479545 RepID=A0ABT3GT74_9RHOB|nr:alpha-hydroxy acid oxidase [Pararhodobacter zhoushanensis]MCW1930752.1 alpha-hydroxy-acid oxidizing protein [Pararhodobacter zhoushanensis]